MSDRALLEELLMFIDEINEINHDKEESYDNIQHKAEEIRTRMTTVQSMCKYKGNYCKIDGEYLTLPCNSECDCWQPKEKKDV